MDLSELSKIDVKDLKNLDYKKLSADSLKHPDWIINFVAVVAAFFACAFYLTKGQQESQAYRAQLPALQEKAKIIQEHQKLEDDLRTFLNTVPEPYVGEELINHVMDAAVKHKIQVESINPVQNKSEPLYDSENIRLTLKVEDYGNLWLFIREIEKSARATWIVNFSANQDESNLGRRQRQRDSEETGPNLIHVEMEIASVRIKKDT